MCPLEGTLLQPIGSNQRNWKTIFPLDLCQKRYEQGALSRTYCFLRLPLDTSPSIKGLPQHSVAHPHVSDRLLCNPTWEIAIRFTVLKHYLWRKNNDLTDTLYHIIMSVTEYDAKPLPSSTFNSLKLFPQTHLHITSQLFSPSSKLSTPLHKTSICVRVPYTSCGLHVQHFSTSAILCRTYTFNIISLRSILKCPLRPNSCFWISRNFVVRPFHIIKMNTFWPDTPCNFEDRYQHFGCNCRITEDGSRKFSRNTDVYFLNYTASRFRRL